MNDGMTPRKDGRKIIEPEPVRAGGMPMIFFVYFQCINAKKSLMNK